jgi:hypothetical protein
MNKLLTFDEWLEYQDGEKTLDVLREEYLEYLERYEKRQQRRNGKRLDHWKDRR